MYVVQKVIILTAEGEPNVKYHLLKDSIPMYVVNSYLDITNKENTCKQYAYILRDFFEFLDRRGKVYKEAVKRDVKRFIDYKLFGLKEEDIFYIGSGKVTYRTISKYITVIKEFYKYLSGEDEGDIESNMQIQNKSRTNKHAYLYGQVWKVKETEIIGINLSKVKVPRDYIKWYSEEEKEMLIEGFSTLRDKAVFLLTLEGMRIDEVLSLREIDYDSINHEVNLYRSKGQQDGNVEKSVVLPEKTEKALNDYIFNERDNVLILLEERNIDWDYPEYLFLNLKDDKNLGKPLSYRNFIKILKKVSEKVGMDPSKIRTHSGRSTKTMELLHHQVMYPEDNMTDEQIRQLMRWESPDSIKPYINYKDQRLSIESARKINKRKK